MKPSLVHSAVNSQGGFFSWSLHDQILRVEARLVGTRPVGQVRYKSPEMVRRGQFVLASWMQLSGRLIDSADVDSWWVLLFKQISGYEVANRPSRL